MSLTARQLVRLLAKVSTHTWAFRPFLIRNETDHHSSSIAYLSLPNSAVPTRTCVAPKRTATSKSALMPIDSRGQPVALRDLRKEREMRRRGLVGRRDAHQAIDRKPVCCAAVLMNASDSSGSTPAFCGSAPVLTSTNRRGRRPCRSISLASAAARLGRSSAWMASNSATASLALFDCSGPTRCSSMSGYFSFRAGHLAFASWTRFSPKTRWPGRDQGLDRLGAERLGDRDQRHRGGVAPGDAARGFDRTANRRQTRGKANPKFRLWRGSLAAMGRLVGARLLDRSLGRRYSPRRGSTTHQSR